MNEELGNTTRYHPGSFDVLEIAGVMKHISVHVPSSIWSLILIALFELLICINNVGNIALLHQHQVFEAM